MSFRPEGGIPVDYARTKHAVLSKVLGIPLFDKLRAGYSVNSIRNDKFQLSS